MGAKKHVVDLSNEDRRTLEWFTKTGERKAEDINRVRILLKADDGLTDFRISEPVGCYWKTAYNTRKAYADRGLAAIHRRNPDREYDIKMDGKAEAHLINSPAANHQKDMLTGRSISLLTNSLPLTRSTSSRSLTKPSDSG